MARYILSGAGNVDQRNHLNNLDQWHDNGHHERGTRLQYMAYYAVENCPKNSSAQKARPANYPAQLGFTPSIHVAFQAGPNQTWEGHALSGGYRLDFQGYTANQQHANWQIQFGRGQPPTGGTAAAVLMRLNSDFSVGHFIEALHRSLVNQQTVLLEP